MNDVVFTVCENGAELPASEFEDAGSAFAAAVDHKRANPAEVVTILVNIDEVEIRVRGEDAARIADALDTLLSLDEGENTDYDDLVRLRDLVRGAIVLT